VICSELLQRAAERGGDTEWRRRGCFKGRAREEMLNGEMVFITILVWGKRREL